MSYSLQGGGGGSYLTTFRGGLVLLASRGGGGVLSYYLQGGLSYIGSYPTAPHDFSRLLDSVPPIAENFEIIEKIGEGMAPKWVGLEVCDSVMSIQAHSAQCTSHIPKAFQSNTTH